MAKALEVGAVTGKTTIEDGNIVIRFDEMALTTMVMTAVLHAQEVEEKQQAKPAARKRSIPRPATRKAKGKKRDWSAIVAKRKETMRRNGTLPQQKEQHAEAL